tara:strand:- start:10687 stop:11523 length:837 start_codon:yes stop_codon:yes gene_type:complete
LSRNKNRLEGHRPEHTETPTQLNPLNFVTPTDFVELPSQGLGYSDDHPLHGQETIEIKFMTAKDEDILSSAALLKKGLAIDRFLSNIILDKTIDTKSLLVGDKNAILVAARGSGYGFDYEAVITCPECNKKNFVTFDLRNPQMVGQLNVDQTIVTKVNSNRYKTTMPYSKFAIVYRLMTGADEDFLTSELKNASEEREHNLLTGQFKRLIESIEGHEDQSVINQFVDNMPTIDSRHLKLCIRATTPNVEIKETLNCSECSFTKEVDVPFGTDFFWPDL